MRFDRGHFVSAIVGGAVAVLLMAVLPAVAVEGQPMVLGEKNLSRAVTRLNTRGGLRIDNVKAGNPALILNVADPASAPLEVNATGLVDNLNADRLDGHHATDFLSADRHDTDKDGDIDFAQDADTVDGRHAVEFLPRLGKARDSRHADEADNADALQGYAANELLRVTQGNTSNAPDRDGIAVQASITAPGPGWLIVSGSLDAVGDDYEIYSCAVWVDETVIPNSGRVSTVDMDLFGTFNDQENCSSDGVMSVEEGIHTVSLRTYRTGTHVTYGPATIWALYVPFNGQGNPYTP